jgi:5'-methylthioadenosine phosphorylase
MDEPYCPNLRKKFVKHAKKTGLEIKGEAVYVCTEGPRFETASEIKMFQKLGADVVGMTNVPEVVLANELGMCYQTVAIITNWCTGFKGQLLDHDIKGIMEENRELITSTFISVLTEEVLTQDECDCENPLLYMGLL